MSEFERTLAEQQLNPEAFMTDEELDEKGIARYVKYTGRDHMFSSPDLMNRTVVDKVFNSSKIRKVGQLWSGWLIVDSVEIMTENNTWSISNELGQILGKD